MMTISVGECTYTLLHYNMLPVILSAYKGNLLYTAVFFAIFPLWPLFLVASSIIVDSKEPIGEQVNSLLVFKPTVIVTIVATIET